MFTRFIYPYDSLFKEHFPFSWISNYRKDRGNFGSFTKLDEEYGYLVKTRHVASLQVHVLLRKEVIQPQVLLRLPCYDFTPVTSPTFDSCLLR